MGPSRGVPLAGFGATNSAQISMRIDPSTIRLSEKTFRFTYSRRSLQPPPTERENAKGASASATSSSPEGTYLQSLYSSPSLEAEILRNLKDGVMTVVDISLIRVVNHMGFYYSLDNARLWILKEYGHPIPVTIVDQYPDDFLENLKRLQNAAETIVVVEDSSEGRDNQTSDNKWVDIVLGWSLREIINERFGLKHGVAI